MDNKFYLIMTSIHLLFWLSMYLFRYKSKICGRRVDAFDPFFLVTGLYFMIFVIAPWIWINRGQNSYQGVQVMKYLPVATGVFNIGYAAYALGSMCVKEERTVQTTDDGFVEFIKENKTQSFIVKYGFVLFFGSFALAMLYYALTGRGLLFMLTLGQGEERQAGIGGLGIYFLSQFIRSTIPGFLLLLWFSKKYRGWLWVLAYLICAICISTGSRNLAICVILAILATQYMKKGKRPSMWLVLLGILLMYFFVGFIGMFRGTIKAGGEIDLSLVSGEGLFNAFMFNIEIFYPFYTLVGYMTKGIVKCHYGLGVLNIPIQFIPRAIWPGKPVTFGKTAFEAMYGDSMGGAAYPNIGEYYYEFGLFGVILLMFLTGFILRKCYANTRHSKNPLTIIAFVMLFGYVMQFICRGHFASWALDIVFMFGPILLLKLILQYKYNTRSRSLIERNHGGKNL